MTLSPILDLGQTTTTLLDILCRQMLRSHCLLTSPPRSLPNQVTTAVLLLAMIASLGNLKTLAAKETSSTASRPNVLLFLVDDLGWADLGCYGSTYHETPQIDALAESGTRFTNAYAACPVCSPTRASILTGRHPVRVDITDWIPGMSTDRAQNPRFQHVDDRDNLALNEVTLAEHLRDAADYQTFFLGKWHLGDVGHLPTDQGFQINIGGGHKGSPPGGYYSPWRNPYLKAKHDGEYLTTRLTDEAISLVDTASSEDKPFFMMMSYYNVHSPITPDKRTIDHFQEKQANTPELRGDTPTIAERDAITRGRQDNPAYASMVKAVDTSVGRIMQALKEHGVDDNTLVVFFSDNGGLSTLRKFGPTCNSPLRAGKGWLYEGGIREPLLVRLPKTAPDAARAKTAALQPKIIDTIACSTDLFPTILDVVGLPLQPELHADGISLLPAIKGEASGADSTSRDLHWHYPHYHGSLWRPGAAIRRGNYKLIEFYETDTAELYDLSVDMGETKDLSKTEPERFTKLRDALRQWQTEMDAKMPVPNPNFTSSN
ncbi:MULTISPECIES: sulfatase [Rhodopirellula]|uniref:sulfatase n=1 Tax=Rhodopirellula TaxID=265488 RepID=UPI00257F47A8|nr:sulfatase [Rhodopirellula sp. UBA1907]|tara:strand:- start:8649 stop:10283 length:1635 start_codon:yes stop_codon:yes gene_type:complete